MNKWNMVIDIAKCHDCNNCFLACKDEYCENDFPPYSSAQPRHRHRWIDILRKERGQYPRVDVSYLPIPCMHCDDADCIKAAGNEAIYKRDDGIVIVDHHRCIGCRYCMIACPFNARWFNFKDNEHWPNKAQPKRSHGVAESCTLCAHRLDVGGTPACVEACREKGAGVASEGIGALFVGDLNDPQSDVSRMIAEKAVKRIREDLGTAPKVYYIDL